MKTTGHNIILGLFAF